MVNDVPSLTFVSASYSVETGEAERIAVDHVARTVETANSSTAQRALQRCHVPLCRPLTPRPSRRTSYGPAERGEDAGGARQGAA